MEKQHGFHWEKSQKTVSRPAIYHLSFDGEEWRKIGASIIGRESQLQEIAKLAQNRDEVEELLKIGEKRGAFAFLLKHLALRAMTEYEVQTLLTRHFVEANTIQETLQKVVRDGYVSDASMIESLIKRYLEQKKSCRDIEIRLERRFGRRISIESSASDATTLQNLMEKRYMKEVVAAEGDYKKRHKLIAKLVRKGFSYELVRSLIQAVSD
ncbi:MAG: RecX family transcriptional regulator [Chlamydia sp.]